eukprot:Nitzschia sp. Nitz4//scaffold24_size164493//80519//81628//NITZ4_002329-RA/size164493-processed-gene-0.108-mRNA-1//-1//CDS//3329544117//3232//frame0
MVCVRSYLWLATVIMLCAHASWGICDQQESLRTTIDSIQTTRTRWHHWLSKPGSPTESYPREPVSSILPKKLYVVYGLESSGTTFTTQAIAANLNITDLKGDFLQTLDGEIQVQHISLPWGGLDMKQLPRGTRQRDAQLNLPILPVLYPLGCQVDNQRGKAPPALVKVNKPECASIMGHQVLVRPSRFFVDITTHVEWFRERGVQVYPIMVVRDTYLHFEGIIDHTNNKNSHCPYPDAAYKQMEIGRAIMAETIQTSNPVHPTLVSYEAMMTLQTPYIDQLFRQLDMTTPARSPPKLKNGNTKHVTSQPPLRTQHVTGQEEQAKANHGILKALDKALLDEERSIVTTAPPRPAKVLSSPLDYSISFQES